DVSQRGGHREWMLHGVEPPRVGIEPELPQQLDREALLRIDVEGTRPRDIVVRVELGHRRHAQHERVLQYLQYRLRVCRPDTRLARWSARPSAPWGGIIVS